MRHRFLEIATTAAVRAEQERRGSRAHYAGLESGEVANDRLGAPEAAFVAARDGFYLATVGATGWPYVQFRGGPPGFLKPLDERTLGYADFRGNRQYLSTGNLRGDDRVALFLMDYANRRRLKILGRATIRDAGEAPDLARRLAIDGYRARVERAIVIRVEAFDWNCPQHITPRYTEAEIAGALAGLHARIAELEAEVSRRQAAPRSAPSVDAS